MQSEQLPVLSLADDAERFSQAIGTSFRDYGFAMVTDHGIDLSLIDRAWQLTEEFFAQSPQAKRHYHVAAIAGARGYTPFGTEIAKGASAHDIKEFWHVGREIADNSPLRATMPPNVWPAAPAGFHDCFEELYRAFDTAGSVILSRIAVYLGLDEHWFDPAIADGNSVLRLLHYPPITDTDTSGLGEGAIRAGAHEDINLITLLLGAQEAGLELLTKQGTWLELAPPKDAMVINIGDMLQRLTNNVLPSTTHRVRNPAGSRAGFSRYSMPFFLHPRSEFPLATLPCCISADNPDHYPVTITADEYLQERLREIGLKQHV